VIDTDRAIAFLAKSRSKLLAESARWLVEYDDPVDLLFILSRDTADAMGPYETFRYAALLGLIPAGPVRELGLDVLAEPLSDEDKTPPVAHAFALAHARRAFPEEDAPYAAHVLDALEERKPAGMHAGHIAAAKLAVAAVAGEEPAPYADALRAALDDDDAVAWSATAYEAAALSEASDALTARALERVSEGQQADGGLTALLSHDVFRGLATLRVVCLLAPPGRAGA
jgi:hypothetical protein